MKKLLFFLAALMFVASCAKDTTTTPEFKGEKVVSFKVTAPKIQTRYGEGAEANQLFWAVYKNGQRLDDISVIDPAEAVAINMSVDVEISLMEGIDYDILFWAQNENAPYTFDGEKVTIDYDALSANEEIYDAFFRNYHVDSDQTEPHRVELRRPFAQLNIGTADTAKAATAGFTLENTSVTVEACTVLDLATGEASEPKELTFAMSQKASDTYGDDPDTFDIISMNYLLVNNEKKVVDVTFNAEGGNDAIEREYLNVPLQRNHRTYILGDILTSSKLFNVYINPAFEDEDLFPEDNDANNGTDNGTTSVIYYTSTDGSIVVPDQQNTMEPFTPDFGANIVSNTYENGQGKIIFDGPVTVIGDQAFEHCSTLASIIIPDGVTKLGGNSFYSCHGLTSITIPDSVTEIGGCAFAYCSSLTSITIPDGVTSIGESAFTDCNSLTNLTITGDVSVIGEGAFKYCSSLTSITILDSVTEIGDRAFMDCTGLTSINIPDGLTSIGAEAFSRCYGLTSITIPDSLTSIGAEAFYRCRNLTNIAIPDSVTEIGKSAFYDCCSLTGDIIIPEGITEIEGTTFSYCSGLTSITIPDSVTEIGAEAFYRCGGLTSITIPDSVTSIGKSAFSNCGGLTSITIPDSVTSIGESAFSRCGGLTSITIPDSVVELGASVVCGCSNLAVIDSKFATDDNRCLIIDGVLGSFAPAGLTSYIIPDSVTEIGAEAFFSCGGLTSITIPDSVTSIGESAFSNCGGLTSITIPDSVIEIGDSVFAGCCIGNVYCKAINPPVLVYDEMMGCCLFDENYLSAIYVPTESVDDYKNADGWSDYADRIVDGGF